MLQESMKKEMSCTQGTYSVLDLFRKPTMRTITVCLSAVWYISCSYCGKKKFHKYFLSAIYDIAMITCMFFILRLSTSFAYYGLSMDLQKFGVDIYLIQVIFGAVDIPAKVVITVSMSFIGRRPSQCGALIVAGITILINLLVPYGMLKHMRTSKGWVLHIQSRTYHTAEFLYYKNNRVYIAPLCR